MAYPFPAPVILYRRARQPGAAWTSASSWFGGKPGLGRHAWPRSAGSQPMHFVAQIDLAELARATGPSVLPQTGSLAFFIGHNEKGMAAGVIHVLESDGSATEPPPGTPAVEEVGGDIFPPDPATPGPPLFPFWPLTIAPLPASADGVVDDAEVPKRFPTRPYMFGAREAWKLLGDAPHPYWWHTAHIFAGRLQTALRHLPKRIEQHRSFAAAYRTRLAQAGPKPNGGGFGKRTATPTPDRQKLEAALAASNQTVARFEQRTPEFQQFVAEVCRWASANPVWDHMTAEAVAQLNTAFAGAKKDFAEFTAFWVPHGLDELETRTLLALMGAEEDAFVTMPEPIRELINARYCLATGAWHQMFGVGVEIQSNAAVENEGNIMLLQLVYDDVMGWNFGDMGAYQFWIAPEDLAAGNWHRVGVTFECH